MAVFYRSAKSKSNSISPEEYQKYRRKFKLKECRVVLNQVDLEELKIKYEVSRANEAGRRSRRVVCYVCLAKFSTSVELEIHKKLHEEDEVIEIEEAIKPIKDKNFIDLSRSSPSPSPLENKSDTLKSTTPSQPPAVTTSDTLVFKCTTCNCYFKSGVNLFDHVRENKGKACKFFCESCNKAFNYPVEFSQHISKHLSSIVKSTQKVSKDSNDVRPTNFLNQTPTVGKYKCVVCMRVFEDCFQLKRHYILGHKLIESEINNHTKHYILGHKKEPEMSIQYTKEIPSHTLSEPDKSNQAPRVYTTALETNKSDISNQAVRKIQTGVVTSSDKKIDSKNKIDRNLKSNSNVNPEEGKTDVEKSADTNENTTLTCNLCFDEFQSQEDLNQHFVLHMQLEKKQKTKPTKQNESKNNDVIVIDDDDDDNSSNKVSPQKTNDKLKQSLKFKTLKLVPSVGNLVATPGTSLLKNSLVKGTTPCPPLVFNNSNVKLLGPLGLLKQPTQMFLVSNVNLQKPAAQQDANKVKLLKTGPTSFQLCFDSQGNPGSSSSSPSTSQKVKTYGPSTSSNLSSTGSAETSLQADKLSATINVGRNKGNLENTIKVTNVTSLSEVSANKQTSGNITSTIGSSSDTVATLDGGTITSGVTTVTNTDVPSLITSDISDSSSTASLVATTTSLTSPSLTSPTVNTNNAVVDRSTANMGASSTSSTVINTTDNSGSVDEISQPCSPSTIINKNKCIAGTMSQTNRNHEDSEDDMDHLVIDEEQIDESNSVGDRTSDTAQTSDNEPSVFKKPDTESSIEKPDTESLIEKPKIFVRRLSDLMDPGKIKDEAKEKKKEKLAQMKTCSDCHVMFTKVRAYRIHLKKKHACIKCDFKNCRIHTMKTHYQSKHDLYLCIRCKAVAENGYDLYKHNESVHKCPDCLHYTGNFETHKPKCSGIPKSKKSNSKSSASSKQNQEISKQNEEEEQPSSKQDQEEEQPHSSDSQSNM